MVSSLVAIHLLSPVIIRFWENHKQVKKPLSLQQLNGTWHRVISAVAIVDTTTENSSVSHIWSRVRFHNIPPDVIRQYVSTAEPLGKAGGYAIQGLGGFLVEKVEGSFTAVVGMPFEILVPLLSEFDVQIWHYWKS